MSVCANLKLLQLQQLQCLTTGPTILIQQNNSTIISRMLIINLIQSTKVSVLLCSISLTRKKMARQMLQVVITPSRSTSQTKLFQYLNISTRQAFQTRKTLYGYLTQQCPICLRMCATSIMDSLSCKTSLHTKYQQTMLETTKPGYPLSSSHFRLILVCMTPLRMPLEFSCPSSFYQPTFHQFTILCT